MHDFVAVIITLCVLLVAISVSRIARVLGELRTRRTANRLRLLGMLSDDVQ